MLWSSGRRSPGGFIEEHDRRIVDQFQGDGQTFTLAAGQRAGASVGTVQEPQRREDLIDLDVERQVKNSSVRRRRGYVVCPESSESSAQLHLRKWTLAHQFFLDVQSFIQF